MEQIFLIANWANYLLQGALVAMIWLAARRWGGSTAKLAALINVPAWTAVTVFGFLPLTETRAMAVGCSFDLLTAAAFLYVAVRDNSPWISVAVLAQGVQTAIDVIYVGQGSSFDRIHHFLLGAVENLFTYAIQVAIIGAVLADRRRLALQAPVRV